MSIDSLLRSVLHPSKSYQSSEARAIYFAAIAGTVSFITALFYFSGHGDIPIFGRVSIGTTAIALSSIAAFIGYYLVLYQNREHTARSSLLHKTSVFLDMFALAFIHGALVFLLSTIVYYVVSEAFTGVLIDKYASSIIVAATVVVAAYAFYLIATNATTLMISSALAVFLVSGALTSMITASDPYWWQLHLSSLGSGDGFSSYAFNLTLIIGGVVIISIADLIANDFAKLKTYDTKFSRTNSRLIRIFLMLMGIGLAGVGLFPIDRHLALHNLSASSMFFMFIGLVIGLRSLVPTFSRAFFVVSYALVGVLCVCLMLFVRVGYFDLTAFEIICFLVLFGWLVVFIRQIAAALHDEQRHVRSQVLRSDVIAK
jgi:hypothetical membrane protein